MSLVSGQKQVLNAQALVNGTSGHADDYDDTQLASSQDRIYGLLTHPTVPVPASALAVGEEQIFSGKEFLEAFVTGFEVECKIAEAIYPNHYRRGFHTTGTIGTFGSFGASCFLRNLSEKGIRYGLSIAASLASGIRVNFGTMTKPLHAGRAAENGITASGLGQMGYTADQDGLDGEWGFFRVFGGDSMRIRSLENLVNHIQFLILVRRLRCIHVAHWVSHLWILYLRLLRRIIYYLKMFPR